MTKAARILILLFVAAMGNSAIAMPPPKPTGVAPVLAPPSAPQIAPMVATPATASPMPLAPEPAVPAATVPAANNAVGEAPGAVTTASPPDTGNNAVPLSGERPAVLKSWSESLMFPADRTRRLLEAVVDYERNQGQVFAEEPIEEVEVETGAAGAAIVDTPLPTFRLSSVLIDPVYGWRIVVGGRRLDQASNNASSDLQVLGVTPGSATLRWQPSDPELRRALARKVRARREAGASSIDGLPGKNRVAALVPASNMTMAGAAVKRSLLDTGPQKSQPATPPSVRFTLRLNQTFVPQYMAVYEGQGPTPPPAVAAAPVTLADPSAPAATPLPGEQTLGNIPAPEAALPVPASVPTPINQGALGVYPIPPSKGGIDNVSATIGNLLKSNPTPVPATPPPAATPAQP